MTITLPPHFKPIIQKQSQNPGLAHKEIQNQSMLFLPENPNRNPYRQTSHSAQRQSANLQAAATNKQANISA
jgi:hypothetical protein